jgi:DNA-binding MarR family transcriptional regulator
LSTPEVPPLIGALLRLPAQAIQRRLIAELNQAGFEELRLPHMSVLQYPGPDGFRPIELAERAGMSKQAMNSLLRSLERNGYIRRGTGGSGNARVVRSTERGRAAWDQMVASLYGIEREWRDALGDDHFFLLKDLLAEVWTSGLLGEATQAA